MASPACITRNWSRPGSRSIGPLHHSATCGRASQLATTGRSVAVNRRKSIAHENTNATVIHHHELERAAPFRVAALEVGSGNSADPCESCAGGCAIRQVVVAPDPVLG